MFSSIVPNVNIKKASFQPLRGLGTSKAILHSMCWLCEQVTNEITNVQMTYFLYAKSIVHHVNQKQGHMLNVDVAFRVDFVLFSYDYPICGQ